MKRHPARSLRDALADRGEFLRIILIGSLLALGVNLITSAIDKALETVSLNWSLWVLAIAGIGSTLLSISLLGIGVFGSRRIAKEIEAVIIYDPADNSLKAITGYEFSEHVTNALKAIFQENPAFRTIWEREPPVLASGISANSSSSQEPSTTCQGKPDDKTTAPKYISVVRIDDEPTAPEPKSFALMREVIEFVVLEKLSAHLSTYFDRTEEDSSQFIREYLREDVPELLLRNRVLALLSSPLEARAPFSELALEGNLPPGELHLLLGENGTMFSRFDLKLPKGSIIRRQDPHVLHIDSKRLSITLRPTYWGACSVVPHDFLYFYVGMRNTREVVCQSCRIEVEAVVKRGALLLPSGWYMYRWVDSFLDEIEEFGSLDIFLDKIKWPAIAANLHISRLQAQRRTKEARVHPDDTRDQQHSVHDGSELVIQSATYGAGDKTRDVTQLVRSRVSEGRLEIRVCNEEFDGDPIPGVVKNLRVTYSHAGQEHSITVDEREMLSLP